MAKKPKASGPREVNIPPNQRFSATYHTDEQCERALSGEQIPRALGHKVTQACVIRGMGFHPGYATELRGTLPIFIRALNARQIMSDVIPDMSQPEDFPYCIWYPEVAKENTYRELIARYPQLKYHVGRACAVAGYTTLYKELDILPDVHIAEEARDNGSHEIFESIMSHNKMFSIMNDYKLKTEDGYDPASLPPTYINGDTADRSLLGAKREYKWNVLRWPSRDCYFNINEDYCLNRRLYPRSSYRRAKSGSPTSLHPSASESSTATE